MKLSVNERLDIKSINLIKNIIRHNIVYNINDDSIQRWQEYINESFKELGLKKSIDVNNVIAQSTKALIHRKFVNHTDFFINPLINVSGSRIKLLDMCKLINYGNIEMPGTYLYTKAFNLSEIEINEMKMRGLI